MTFVGPSDQPSSHVFRCLILWITIVEWFSHNNIRKAIADGFAELETVRALMLLRVLRE